MLKTLLAEGATDFEVTDALHQSWMRGEPRHYKVLGKDPTMDPSFDGQLFGPDLILTRPHGPFNDAVAL